MQWCIIEQQKIMRDQEDSDFTDGGGGGGGYYVNWESMGQCVCLEVWLGLPLWRHSVWLDRLVRIRSFREREPYMWKQERGTHNLHGNLRSRIMVHC